MGSTLVRWTRILLVSSAASIITVAGTTVWVVLGRLEGHTKGATALLQGSSELDLRYAQSTDLRQGMGASACLD